MATFRNGFVDKLDANEVFVFGSNLAGRHGAGAALTAKDQFGARWGIGEGRTGQSYALPTADYDPSLGGYKSYPPLGLDRIKQSLDGLRAAAESDPGTRFLLTRIGMGRSGYKESEIKPLIEAANLPGNVSPYWEWESGQQAARASASRPSAKPLLFGGATARKRYAGGTNYYGNDHKATSYLSNYAELPVPVEYGGVRFPSTEQAYVAAKFNDPALSQFIAELGSGVDRHGNTTQPAQVARNLGRSSDRDQWKQAGWSGPTPVLRSDWNDVKVQVMEDLVRQKFQNNPAFRDFLVNTGDRELIEHTTGWDDQIWGMVDPTVGRLGSRNAQVDRLVGENHLGRTLMMVRGELGGAGLVGRHVVMEAPAPAPAAAAQRMAGESVEPAGGEASMPEQPAAAVNPTGQQQADAVQLDLWEKGKRFAGDAWPYLAAAGGAGLVGYAVADLMGGDEVQREVMGH